MRSDSCAGGIQRSPSPIEQGLLFHYFCEADGAYVDQMVCDIVGRLDVPCFQQAIQRLVGLHESLRTRYVSGPGLKARCVVRESSETRIVAFDRSAETEPRAMVNRHVAAEAADRLDLSIQVSRCSLHRLHERLHVFAWTYHHAVADSWTLRLFQEQFSAVYRALLEGRPDGEKATPYSAYVHWIAHQDRSATLSWWAAYLKRVTPRRVIGLASATPVDRTCMHVMLPVEVCENVEDVRRRFKVTRNVVLLAVWGILALDQRKTRQCLLGCVVHGRGVPVHGIEDVAGVCSNTAPIVIDDSIPIARLLADLQRDLFAANARSYLALSEILATQGLSHRDMHSVVNFTIDERIVRNRHTAHLPFEIVNVRYRQAANFDAYLDVEIEPARIAITIHYDRSRRYFAESDIAWTFERIVSCFASTPDGTVRDVLDVLLKDTHQCEAAFTFDDNGDGVCQA